LALALRDVVQSANSRLRAGFMSGFWTATLRFGKRYGRDGRLARTWPTGSMAFWVGVLLASLLLFGVRQH